MQQPGDNHRTGTIAAGATFGVLLLACFVRPDLSRGHDEMLYLAAADNFVKQGLSYVYTREPLYPLFLAMLKMAGIDPVRWIPLIQNAAFMGAMYFFLRSLLCRRQSRAQSLLLSAMMALVPTFLVPLNGSIYTESLSASLVLLMLGACARLSTTQSLGAAGASLLLAFCCSLLLGLIKGTFSYIHIAFAALGLLWLLIAKWMSKHGAVPARKWVLAFLLIGAGSHAGSELWLRIQQSRSNEPLSVYSRGGVVLYGRTEYAKNFDFAKQSAPYLVCAISISAYRRIYSDDGFAYTFDAENAIGYRKHDQEHVSDAELFKLGVQNIAAQPFRQSFFSLYELARFPIHHTNAGFATLDFPGLGAIFHSGALAVMLKIFNFLLLAMIPAFLWGSRVQIFSGRAICLADDPAKTGTAIYLLYALAYLGVYSFASTIVRMVYPIAPLLVVLNWQMLKAWRKRSTGVSPVS